MIASLLYVLRPREWPEYFTVGLIGEDQNENDLNDNLIENYKITPMFNTSIDTKVYDSLTSRKSGDLDSSFNSNEQVVVLNPCDYEK